MSIAQDGWRTLAETIIAIDASTFHGSMSQCGHVMELWAGLRCRVVTSDQLPEEFRGQWYREPFKGGSLPGVALLHTPAHPTAKPLAHDLYWFVTASALRFEGEGV